jgi:hypothetical protein
MSHLSHLDLESIGSPATTSLLELSALGDSSGFDTIVSVRVGWGSAVTEVSDRLTGVLGTTEKDSVGSLWTAKSQLIKSDALTTGLDNSGSGGLSESESSDSKLRNLQKTSIVSDGTNNNSSLAILSLQVSSQTRDGDRRVVDLGHSQSLDNSRGELGLGTSRQETVYK